MRFRRSTENPGVKWDSMHLPIIALRESPVFWAHRSCGAPSLSSAWTARSSILRSEEHTSELQSQSNLVCRLLLEKKKKKTYRNSLSLNTPIYSDALFT